MFVSFGETAIVLWTTHKPPGIPFCTPRIRFLLSQTSQTRTSSPSSVNENYRGKNPPRTPFDYVSKAILFLSVFWRNPTYTCKTALVFIGRPPRVCQGLAYIALWAVYVGGLLLLYNTHLICTFVYVANT